MAKMTIEFDLDDPSDERAANRALTTTDAYLALHDIAEILRNHTRRGGKPLTQDMFIEILNDRNINMNLLE